MIDINSLLIESSIDNEPVEEEVVTEWKVDSKEKEKVIKSALSDFSKELDKDVKKYVTFADDSNIEKYNFTIIRKLTKKSIYESKGKKIFIGEYFFPFATDRRSLYRTLKANIKEFNENHVGKCKIAIYNKVDSGGYAISALETAYLRLTINKDSIKESGINFADSVMESLFG